MHIDWDVPIEMDDGWWYLNGEGDWKETQPPVQRQSRRPGERFEVVGDSDGRIPRRAGRSSISKPRGAR
jgi:hypothetical protein